MDSLSKKPLELAAAAKTNAIVDPTGKCAEAREFFYDRLELVERVAVETDGSLSSYILKAVTQGLSYEGLKEEFRIPCCKEVYYRLYRRFFWLLDRARN